MRVALAHPTYWPEVRRGAERMVHDLATGLAARRHDTRIVTSAPVRGVPIAVFHRGHDGSTAILRERLRTRSVEDGVTVLRLPRPPGGGRLARRGYEDFLTALPLTYAALRAGDDDVVHAFQVPDAAAAARLDTPSIYAHMGIPHRAWLTSKRARLQLVQEAVTGCDAVTALSEHARDAFHRWLGVEAEVMPPPVDTTQFTPGGERTPEPTVVCAADATEPRKRVPLLIEAMGIVRRSYPTARLQLDERTAKLGMGPGPKPNFLDLVDMTDLPAVYRSAWVSALPSWGEAFGLVLAEALACGTPVVGADREGIPEVLGADDRVGRLFSGDDPTALATALNETLELAQDPGTPAACRARAETFSLARCVDRHERLYASLIG